MKNKQNTISNLEKILKALEERNVNKPQVNQVVNDYIKELEKNDKQ